MTLDELVSSENLIRVDYIKIDVEGAEIQVLRGGTKTIEKFRPIIQMEVTIFDVLVDLVDYSIFQAPQSPNKVCIPNEHWAIHLPDTMGWKQEH